MLSIPRTRGAIDARPGHRGHLTKKVAKEEPSTKSSRRPQVPHPRSVLGTVYGRQIVRFLLASGTQRKFCLSAGLTPTGRLGPRKSQRLCLALASFSGNQRCQARFLESSD